MWPGGTLHVVVRTLKISLDRLKKKKGVWYSAVVSVADGAVDKTAEEWLCVEHRTVSCLVK